LTHPPLKPSFCTPKQRLYRSPWQTTVDKQGGLAHKSKTGLDLDVWVSASHRKKVLSTMVNNNDDDSNEGTVELYSYHCPNLIPGKYTVSIDHDITPPNSNWGNTEKWKSNRTFSVVGPRFSIPASDINSVYPIQGQREGPSSVKACKFTQIYVNYSSGKFT
jgi:hypothetical protein